MQTSRPEEKKEFTVVNARIWRQRKFVKGNVKISGDRIMKVSPHATSSVSGEFYDACGRMLLPGLVDVHAHLRHFDLSYKEDFLSGTSAAVAGGFTTVLDMPNSSPPVVLPETLRNRAAAAEGRIFCDVGFYATAPTPKDAKNLAHAGCVGFKVHMQKPLVGEASSSPEYFEALMASTNLVLTVHAGVPSLLGSARDGSTKTLHVPEAEEYGVRIALKAAEKVSGRLHIAHISTRKALSLVTAARARGVDVTCEATPHHLLLTQDDVTRNKRLFLVDPPLRREKDRMALIRGISGGTVQLLATDHAPHTLQEKLSAHPPAGFPGFETAFAVCHTLVRQGLLGIEDLIEGFTSTPSARFGLRDVGSIEVGKRGNLTLFDPRIDWTVKPSAFYSNAKYSPFEGMKLSGRIVATFVAGQLVYQDGVVLDTPLRPGRVVYGSDLRG